MRKQSIPVLAMATIILSLLSASSATTYTSIDLGKLAGAFSEACPIRSKVPGPVWTSNRVKEPFGFAHDKR